MSKFDQKYLDFLENNKDYLEKEGHCMPKTTLDAYLDWSEGNMLCGCDHGCNQTTVENGPKLLAILRSQMSGASQETLDFMALKSPGEFQQEMHEEMWNKVKNRKNNGTPNSL